MGKLMSDLRNWIEKISAKIPGYSGYIDKENRRDADKRNRENLANRIRAIKAPLTEVMKDLTNSGRLFEVTPVDSALKKLDKIENRVRFATYGYAGFFDAVKIEEAQLDAIYRFDLSLVEQVEKIEAQLADLKAQAGTADGLKTSAAKLTASIDTFDRSFDDRYKAINDFNEDQPQGRPLFS
jgi:hypothetical protein